MSKRGSEVIDKKSKWVKGEVIERVSEWKIGRVKGWRKKSKIKI